MIAFSHLLFSEKDNNKLYNKLEREFNGLFILYEYDNILANYLINREKVKCSWNKNNSTEIYIFKK